MFCFFVLMLEVIHLRSSSNLGLKLKRTMALASSGELLSLFFLPLRNLTSKLRWWPSSNPSWNAWAVSTKIAYGLGRVATLMGRFWQWLKLPPTLSCRRVLGHGQDASSMGLVAWSWPSSRSLPSKKIEEVLAMVEIFSSPKL